MLQMYHAVMRFSPNKCEQAHVSFRGESQMHNAGKCCDRSIFNQHIKNELTDTIKSMKGEHKEHSSPFSSLPGMHIQIPVCKVMQDREEDMACKPPRNGTGSDDAPTTPKQKKCTALSECGAQNGRFWDIKWKRSILRMQMYFRMRKPKVMQRKPQAESSIPARR